MKKSIITMMFALAAIAGQAQDVNTCRPIAERILTAAQNHTPDGIDELLAPDFRFANIKQPVAATVLKQIIAQIKTSQSVALVSDAGTPGISDPGFLLLRECVAEGIEVECLPGATALIPAVVNSGLPCDSFYFNGFLPHKKGKESTLRRLSEMKETVVFYESPHRLAKTLVMMQSFFAEDTPISISRELTKIHEENFRGTLAEAITHFPVDKEVKGEIVVVVGGRS